MSKSTFNVDWDADLSYTDANLLPRGIWSAYKLKNAPTSGWVTYLCLPANGNEKYKMQIAIGYDTQKLYVRKSSVYTFSSWRAI